MQYSQKFYISNLLLQVIDQGVIDGHQVVEVNILDDIYEPLALRERIHHMSVDECKDIVEEILNYEYDHVEHSWIDQYSVMIKPDRDQIHCAKDFGRQLELALNQQLDLTCFNVGYDPMHSEIIIEKFQHLKDGTDFVLWQISVFFRNDGQYNVAFDDWLSGTGHRPVIVDADNLTDLQHVLDVAKTEINRIKRGNK